MSYKILNTIGMNYAADAKIILDSLGKVDYLNLTQKDLISKIHHYDILVVGLGLNIDKEVMDKAESLKLIATATTGLDHIDVNYAKTKEMKVIGLRGDVALRSITGTAELAVGLMIDMVRSVSQSFNSIKHYEFNREKYIGSNLCGKTLGIVGLGRLGKLFARYANAFGMNIVAYDPNINKSEFMEANCKSVDFKTLLRESDIITIHADLNATTLNMFNFETFDKMKNTAFLINTARGKIVNEDELINALENKLIAGYATDVLADENSFNVKFGKNNLVEYAKINDNCIITPHIGGMTFESRKSTDILIANKIKTFLSNNE